MKPVGWSVAGHVAVALVVVAFARLHSQYRTAAPPAVAPLQTVLVDASTFRRALRSEPVAAPAEPPPQPAPDPVPDSGPKSAQKPERKPARKPDPKVPEPKVSARPAANPSARAKPEVQSPPSNRAAQDRLAAEAALEAQLAAEVGRATAVAQGAQDEWNLRLRERIEGKWYRPASARRGLRCRVAVTLVPGGTVASAVVEECNGDAAVRESLRSAVMSASPLPMPKDPRMFERKIVLEFTPDD